MENLESGFQSKYERSERIEISGASLEKLLKLEEKYRKTLESDEYAFSKNKNEEGYRIFSKLLSVVREKIEEVRKERQAVSNAASDKGRRLVNELKASVPSGRKKSVESKTRSNAEKSLSEKRDGIRLDAIDIPKPADTPVKTEIAPARAPEPFLKSRAEERKPKEAAQLGGFAGGVRAAAKDAKGVAAKIFGQPD